MQNERRLQSCGYVHRKRKRPQALYERQQLIKAVTNIKFGEGNMVAHTFEKKSRMSPHTKRVLKKHLSVYAMLSVAIIHFAIFELWKTIRLSSFWKAEWKYKKTSKRWEVWNICFGLLSLNNTSTTSEAFFYWFLS